MKRAKVSLAVRLRGFAGLVGQEIQPGRFGSGLDYAKRGVRSSHGRTAAYG